MRDGFGSGNLIQSATRSPEVAEAAPDGVRKTQRVNITSIGDENAALEDVSPLWTSPPDDFRRWASGSTAGGTPISFRKGGNLAAPLDDPNEGRHSATRAPTFCRRRPAIYQEATAI